MNAVSIIFNSLGTVIRMSSLESTFPVGILYENYNEILENVL